MLQWYLIINSYRHVTTIFRNSLYTKLTYMTDLWAKFILKLTKEMVIVVVFSLYYKKISPPPCQESSGRGGEGGGEEGG